MNAADLIEEVKCIGGQLSANGDKLRYRLPPGESKRLVPLLAEHKDSLLAALNERQARRNAAQLEGLAECGDPGCNGCYDLGDGGRIHPPRCSAEHLEWLRKW